MVNKISLYRVFATITSNRTGSLFTSCTSPKQFL